MLDSIGGLGDKVGIIVPSTMHDQPLEPDAFKSEVDRVLLTLSQRYGGATAYPGRGAWVYDSGTLGTEDVVLVESYTDSITDDDIIFVQQVALDVKNRLQQEAVSVLVNGRLVFI